MRLIRIRLPLLSLVLMFSYVSLVWSQLAPTHVTSAAESATGQSSGSKQKVDVIVSGGLVLTMDGARSVHEDGAVAIKGDSILAVGPRSDIESRYTATDTIDARGRAGFAQCLFKLSNIEMPVHGWMPIQRMRVGSEEMLNFREYLA